MRKQSAIVTEKFIFENGLKQIEGQDQRALLI